MHPVRGLLSAVGLPPRAATLAHGAAVWGSAQVALPALDIAPPAIFWAPREIAIDAFHHTVYAVATGIAYELLSNARGARTGISGRSERSGCVTQMTMWSRTMGRGSGHRRRRGFAR